VQHSIPQGGIVQWSGAIVDIPTGFGLCDGTQGTPDLRDKFVVGAGDTYPVADTGGAVQHNHGFTGDGHSHDLEAPVDLDIGGDLDTTTSTDPAVGTTNNGSTLAPYYALAYIMEL
jgi:hypothetical protein